MPFDLARLAETFFDLNAHDRRQRYPERSPGGSEPEGDGVGKKFGRGVGHGQEDAFLAGEAPTAIFVAGEDVGAVVFEEDEGALGGQEHAVVEFVDDGLGLVAEGDEIKDIMVFVEPTVDFDRRSIVMTVNPFAEVAVKGDEMTGREDERVLRDANGITG